MTPHQWPEGLALHWCPPWPLERSKYHQGHDLAMLLRLQMMKDCVRMRYRLCNLLRNYILDCWMLFLWTKIKPFCITLNQGWGKNRLKISVSYFFKTNFLFSTKTNNQLFGIRNNNRPKPKKPINSFEQIEVIFINHSVLKLCTSTAQNCRFKQLISCVWVWFYWYFKYYYHEQ